jgi:hypothetical protein
MLYYFVMIKDWQELTKMTGDEEILVEQVSLPRKGITISGTFDLPPLAKLQMEDQVFVAAFVRSHGSIKEMESLFGISYPTVKNRLNRIGKMLGFLDIKPAEDPSEILNKIENGEITVNEAIEKIKGV